MKCVRNIRNTQAREHVRELDLEFLLLPGVWIVDLDRYSLAPFPPICTGAKGGGLKRKCNQEAWIGSFPWGLFA